MALGWKQISNADEAYLRAALCLLQETIRGYNFLSIEELQRKMGPLSTHPETSLFGLRVYSYAELSDLNNLNSPLVSAFFFLRRIHRPGEENEPWAYCLTFGATPEGGPGGGLTKGALRTALGIVCGTMRNDGDQTPLEVMHTPPRPYFRDQGSNASQFFDDVIATGAAPPRLDSLGTIVVEFPWADSGQSITMTRWNIKES